MKLDGLAELVLLACVTGLLALLAAKVKLWLITDWKRMLKQHRSMWKERDKK